MTVPVKSSGLCLICEPPTHQDDLPLHMVSAHPGAMPEGFVEVVLAAYKVKSG